MSDEDESMDAVTDDPQPEAMPPPAGSWLPSALLLLLSLGLGAFAFTLDWPTDPTVETEEEGVDSTTPQGQPTVRPRRATPKKAGGAKEGGAVVKRMGSGVHLRTVEDSSAVFQVRADASGDVILTPVRRSKRTPGASSKKGGRDGGAGGATFLSPGHGIEVSVGR
jgi:hypothetical protein